MNFWKVFGDPFFAFSGNFPVPKFAILPGGDPRRPEGKKLRGFGRCDFFAFLHDRAVSRWCGLDFLETGCQVAVGVSGTPEIPFAFFYELAGGSSRGRAATSMGAYARMFCRGVRANGRFRVKRICSECRA